jgi:hypothetical protein
MSVNEYKKRIDDPFDSDASKYRRSAGGGVSGEVIAIRVLVSILLAVLLAATLMWSLLYTIANGPSDDYREKLVTDAAASDATKWIPYTLLPAEEIDRILGTTEVGG